MRRSCRLSTKEEHKLLKKAETDAAEAAVAEAAQEGTSVYPSSVTKAIAGLATPALPSPSMFPEDWRMVGELLHKVTHARAAKTHYVMPFDKQKAQCKPRHLICSVLLKQLKFNLLPSPGNAACFAGA